MSEAMTSGHQVLHDNAGRSRVPELAAQAAADLMALQETVDDPSEFPLASIRGFASHIRQMQVALVSVALTPTGDRGRTFLRTAEEARVYCFAHFAPDHGTLLLTHRMMVAVAELTGLDWDAAVAGLNLATVAVKSPLLSAGRH